MWNDQVLAVIYPTETEKLLKKLFAAEWARQHDNPFDAARQVEDHIGRAHFIATNWVNDPEVQAEVTRLRAALGPISHVPTKEQFAAEMYKKAKDAKPAEQLSYYQFFAKIMNYVEDKSTRVIKGDPDNPIEHRHVARMMTDDELACIAASGSKRTAEA